MRSEAELKKLIAEWIFEEVALLWCDQDLECGGYMPIPPEFSESVSKYSEQVWCFKNPEYNHWEELPDLTHSLDALFKWAVPKVIDKQWILHLEYDESKGDWVADLLTTQANVDEFSILGSAETPALALARALENLIDGEEKDGNQS